MNVREEDRPKSNCPSRGLGLAAAAIGVGVGAALYYLFTKQPENPHGEGSTTGWACQEQTFRGRSWSLEECSICFEVLLRDQQVTSLPCTHRFHEACIGPWLREQQTCPNCRKTA